MDLLKTTADAGILSKLEANGLDLVTLEKLLPVIEDTGALSIAGNNQQLLLNLVAPLLVEPAPILLPVVAGALEKGPTAFYGAAAVALVVRQVRGGLPLPGPSFVTETEQSDTATAAPASV